MFHIIDANGRTYHKDPKLESYKYMAMLQRQGRHTSFVCRPSPEYDGLEYEVTSPGLATAVFCQERE